VAAVELRETGHPQIARNDPLTGLLKQAIGQWIGRYLCPSPRVHSDRQSCLPAVTQAGAVHVPQVVGAGRRSMDMSCFT